MEDIFERLMCAGCENIGCEFFTFYLGTMLCSYCLEDLLNPKFEFKDFDEFLIKQRIEMRKDRGELKEGVK